MRHWCYGIELDMVQVDNLLEGYKDIFLEGDYSDEEIMEDMCAQYNLVYFYYDPHTILCPPGTSIRTTDPEYAPPIYVEYQKIRSLLFILRKFDIVVDNAQWRVYDS